MKAFQNLWNLNYPDKKITADGVYGTATANALYNSPCGGFAKTSATLDVEETSFLQ